MKILVQSNATQDHSMALKILAVATGNSLYSSSDLSEDCLNLANMMGSYMHDRGFDAVIGPNCYLNVYEKFGVFNHAIFVCHDLTIDTRAAYLESGDVEGILVYKFGDRQRSTLELTEKYDTQTLFAELQANSPMPPIPFLGDIPSESIVLHRALRLPRGFGALRLAKDDARSIIGELFNAGVKGFLRTEELHITLMYDKSNPIIDTDQPNQDLHYKAQITGVDRYGEAGSRWEAIVLKLDSPDVEARHKYLISRGYRHSYPEFKPHISLKYQPEDGDFEKIQNMFKTGAIPHSVQLHDEYWEECDGD